MAAKKSTLSEVVISHTKGLANTFRRIATDAERLEDTASHILKVVADINARDLKTFDQLVREAYRQNGWNERPGRPSTEAEAATAVPPIVRTYVSEIRAAFRLGLKVRTFESFYQLRRAIREKREQLEAEATVAAKSWPALRGVKVSSPDKLNGALFHDLIVIYDHLDAESGVALERSVKRLLGKYRKLAVQLPEVEEPKETEAAA